MCTCACRLLVGFAFSCVLCFLCFIIFWFLLFADMVSGGLIYSKPGFSSVVMIFLYYP